MTRINRRKGVPKGDRPLKENDEIDARDPVKLPVQPRDELSKPRPDLDWSEHED